MATGRAESVMACCSSGWRAALRSSCPDGNAHNATIDESPCPRPAGLGPHRSPDRPGRDGVRYRCDAVDDGCRIRLRLTEGSRGGHAAEFTLASLVVASQIGGQPVNALAVEFRHA